MEGVLEQVGHYVDSLGVGRVIRDPGSLPSSCPIAVEVGGAISYFHASSAANLEDDWRKAQSEIASLASRQVDSFGRFLTLLVTDAEAYSPNWTGITRDVYVCRKLIIPTQRRDVEEWIGLLPFFPVRPHRSNSGEHYSSPSHALASSRFSPEIADALLGSSRGVEFIASKFLTGHAQVEGTGLVEPSSDTIALRKRVGAKRITHLHMENFRPFGVPTDLSLDADLVVIYGPNGSGKTAICQALEWGVLGHVRTLESKSDDIKALTSAPSPYVHVGTVNAAAKVVLTTSDEEQRHEHIERTITSLGPLITKLNGKTVGEADAISELLASDLGADLDVRRLRVMGRQSHFLDQETIRDWLQEHANARFDALSRMTGTADFQQAKTKLMRVRDYLAQEFSRRVDNRDIAVKKEEMLKAEIEKRFPHFSPSGITQQELESCRDEVLRYVAKEAALESNQMPLPPAALSVHVTARGKTLAENYEKRLTLSNQYRSLAADVDNERTQVDGARSALLNLAQEKEGLRDREAPALRRVVDTREARAQAVLDLQATQAAEQLWRDRVIALGEYRAVLSAFNTADTAQSHAHAVLQASEQKRQRWYEDLKGQRDDIARVERSRDERSRQLSGLSNLEVSLPRVVAAWQRHRALTENQLAMNGDLAHVARRLSVLRRVVDLRISRSTDARNTLAEIVRTDDAVKSLLAEVSTLLSGSICPLCGKDWKTTQRLKERVDEQLTGLSPEHRELQDLTSHLESKASRSQMLLARAQADHDQLTAREASLVREKQQLSLEWKGWLEEATAVGFPVPDQSYDDPSEIGMLLDQWKRQVIADPQQRLESLKAAESTIVSALSKAEVEVSQADAMLRNAAARVRAAQHLVDVATAELTKLMLPPDEWLQPLQTYADEHGKAIETLRVAQQVMAKADSDLGLAVTDVESIETGLNIVVQREERLTSLVESHSRKNEQLRQMRVEMGVEVDEDLTMRNTVWESALAAVRRLLDLAARLGHLSSLLEHDEAYVAVKHEVAVATLERERSEGGVEQAGIAIALVGEAEQALAAGGEAEQHAKLNAYHPVINEIYQRITPHPRYSQLNINVHDEAVLLHAGAPNDTELRLPITQYFSMAQQNVVALAIFLSAALLQNWSHLQLVCIDDPVQQMDDVNPVAFLDVLRGVLNRPDRKHQIVLTTANRDFYKLVLARYAYLNEGATVRFKAYRIVPGSSGSVVVNDSPVVDDDGGVTLLSAAPRKKTSVPKVMLDDDGGRHGGEPHSPAH